MEKRKMIDITSEINRLYDKYGEDFNWGVVPKENGFPRYTEFLDSQKVIEHIEKKYVEEFN